MKPAEWVGSVREQSPCIVCKRLTRKVLFNDSKLHIPICSYECERRYLDTLGERDEANILSHLDNRIARAKHHLRLYWTTAGVGVLVIVAGLLTKIVTIFIAGAFIATVCAFLTRHFEEKAARLTLKRKRISV